MTIVPFTRPELTQAAAESYVRLSGITGAAIVGRRGYYRDTMGMNGRNDRGLYDDCIAIVTPTCFKTFNANCDPSRERPGMATLKPGVWEYRLGIHNISKDPETHPHYLALVQAQPVTVHRDGLGDDTGYFGINIHKGGYTTTSSEGCQTIYPDQWDEFIRLVQAEMTAHHLATIRYVLTERADL